MGRIAKGCVREVGLAQVSCMLVWLRPLQWVRGRRSLGYSSVFISIGSSTEHRHDRLYCSVSCLVYLYPCGKRKAVSGAPEGLRANLNACDTFLIWLNSSGPEVLFS